MNRYLVEYKIEGEYGEPHIVYATKIFDTMDMDDCYDIKIVYLYLLTEDGREPIPCNFFGTWHNFHDPLRMEIRTEDGEVVSVGYGTDH